MHATAVTAIAKAYPLWSAQRAYNSQLLQLLRALPSGSIVPFVLVMPGDDTWNLLIRQILYCVTCVL